MKATKDLILAGAAPAPFAVPALDGAEVILRRLHSGEAKEVQAAQMAGMKVGGDVPTRRGIRPPADHLDKGAIPRETAGEAQISLDLASVVGGSHEANQLAAHYGLVDPVMTLAEVQKADAPTIEEIGQEVIRRSGLSQAAAISQFRGLGRGPDDAGAPDGGDTSGENAG
jgi:hypothetical protein